MLCAAAGTTSSAWKATGRTGPTSAVTTAYRRMERSQVLQLKQ